jgi:hypothetical protein
MGGKIMASERDHIAARERREWIAAEEKRVRLEADDREYKKYVGELRGTGITPLDFDEWRSHIPKELKDADPAIRGVAASAASNLQRLARVATDRIKNSKLTDEELELLGFDLHNRMDIPELLSAPGIAMAFEHFAKRDSRCDLKLHFQPMADFLSRNNLFPSDDHIKRTFNLLNDTHLLLEPPAPAPEAERPAGVNSYGVNLGIERDLALEARQRREKYEREIVVVDPENGKGWTEYQLDHQADSETYRRLMRIPRVYKNPALEPRH